ncbi:MAG: GGDEF domain-containing protein [Gammaproteobacteria bacterium]|nr:GGDEF domain-containing protein [Gammaproteobacteria bacterium]
MTTISEDLTSSQRPIPLKRSEFFAELNRQFGAAGEAQGLAALIVINLQQHRDFSIEFGHRVTELIMLEIASRIQTCLREADCLGRLGSADFSLLLPKLRTQGQAIMAVNKIQRVCQDPVTVRGKALRVRLTFGVSLSPRDATSVQDLLGCAETALRHALA